MNSELLMLLETIHFAVSQNEPQFTFSQYWGKCPQYRVLFQEIPCIFRVPVVQFKCCVKSRLHKRFSY